MESLGADHSHGCPDRGGGDSRSSLDYARVFFTSDPSGTLHSSQALHYQGDPEPGEYPAGCRMDRNDGNWSDSRRKSCGRYLNRCFSPKIFQSSLGCRRCNPERFSFYLSCLGASLSKISAGILQSIPQILGQDSRGSHRHLWGTLEDGRHLQAGTHRGSLLSHRRRAFNHP